MQAPTTRDFSVKFGRDPSRGLEGQKAFPFIYTFVNHNDDTWTPDLTGLLQPSLSCIGPTVAAGATVTHNVMLDPDYNFKLLGIKYTAYKWVSSAYFWYASVPATISDGMDPDMDFIGAPLTDYINMTVSFQGSGAQQLYGGNDPAPIISGRSRIPLPVNVNQGYDFGFLTMRTPRLLPRQGAMVFEITNTFSVALTVGAAIYGMKIRT
jgi:hypothetical protein